MDYARRSIVILLSALAPYLAGCLTDRVPPVAEYPSVPKQSFFLVKKVGYDVHGRPLFNDRISSRPGSVGDQFTVVHAVGGRPARSYDIAVVEGTQADLKRPFAVIYDWTGRGFEGGIAITSGISPQGATISSREEAAAYLAIKAAPIVVATVTGFVVGVLASIPATAIELKNILVDAREMVIASTEYAYDEQGRIRFMKLYPPVEHAGELVRTDFHYDRDSTIPIRTEVTSLAEKKTRSLP